MEDAVFLQDNRAIRRHILLSNDMDFPEEGSETSTRNLPDKEVAIPNRHVQLLRPVIRLPTMMTTMRKVPRWKVDELPFAAAVPPACRKNGKGD